MTLRLLRTHLAAHAGSLLLIATLVLAMATLTALMPRAMTHVLTENLRHEIGGLSTVQRDLSAQEQGSPTPGPAADPSGNTLPEASDPVWGTVDDTLRDAHEAMPSQLRAAFGQGAFAMTFPSTPTTPQDRGTHTKANAILILGIDPRLADDVKITTGRAPRPVAADLPAKDSPVEIVLSDAVAKAMDWPVGQERVTRPNNTPPFDVRLSGTYTAIDDKDPLWTQVQASLKPSIYLPDGGKPVVTGVGWAEPGSYPRLMPVSDGLVVRAWFPLKTSTLTSRGSATVATQLREFTRQAHPVPGEPFAADFRGEASLYGLTRLAFSSDSANAIRDAGIAGSSALAMSALFASGPLGVAVAVLVLAAGLALRQQARSLALVTARGLSEVQLRTLLALEGLLIGLPSAIAGAVIGALVLPSDGSPASWWWPAVIGIAPAVLFAMMRPATGRRERADLTSRDVRSWRRAIDLIVLLCAVAAIVALHRRGLDASAAGAGVDPLLASTPLVLSLAVCLGVIRVYPWVLRRILTRVARWRGSTALLGTARALRDPAAGLAAVLALVTSVGIAVFSGVAMTTLQHGLADTSHAAVGADVVVTGDPVDAELISTLSDRLDVHSLAAISEGTSVPLSLKGHPVYVRVLFTDVAELRRTQAGVPGALTLPRSLERTTGDHVPILVSEEFDGDPSALKIDGFPVDVIGTAPSRNAVTNLTSWIMVDRAAAGRFGQPPGAPDRVLIDTVGSGDAVRDLARQAPGTLEAKTPADVADELADSPLVPGLRRAALLALVSLAVLCASIIALTLVRGEASRSRQSALLGAMGERRRRTRWLVAWEVGPLAVLAVVSGMALGLVLPAVVLGGIDLRAFTTGTDQPAVSIDPVLTVFIAVGVLLVVAVGAVIAATASRRQDLSTALRMMED